MQLREQLHIPSLYIHTHTHAICISVSLTEKLRLTLKKEVKDGYVESDQEIKDQRG